MCGQDYAPNSNELRLEPEKLLRLKHITGFSALFKNRQYSHAWVTANMIEIRQRYEQEQAAQASEIDPPATATVP